MMMEGSGRTGVKNGKGDSDTKITRMDVELTELLLEDKLACLSLSDRQTSKPIPEQERGSLEFPLSVQNDLRVVFKGMIGGLLDIDTNATSKLSVDLSGIQNMLQEPLLKSLEQPGSMISINDSDISSILSYLKLLSEVDTPAPTQQPESESHSNQDVFWTKVVEPILEGILNFLNQLVFKRCIINLSKSTTTLTESSNGMTSTSHHGTGFAFHQQLGLLQKGVRILLVYMKRATSNLTASTEYKERKDKLDNIILEILQELCILMKPLTSKDVKTDFDIGLDIRCNIGVGICYCTYFLRHSNKAHIERFFRSIFDSSGEGSPLKSDLAIEEVRLIEDLASSDLNRIALAFGILNTWLEQEHDATLYLTIGRNVLDIQHGVQEAVNLGSSRVMEIWTDKLSRASVPSSVLHHVSTLFAQLEFFSFMYMPGHIDAVKNCCRNIIHSLSRIYDRLDEENFPSRDKKQTWVTGFLQTILEKPAHLKWMALACVARNTKKALKALELDATLPEKLLTVQRALRNAATDTYIALMSYHFQNTSDHTTWEKTWIHPLFLTQQDSSNKVSNWPQKRKIISIILNSEKLQLKTIQVMVQPLLQSVVKRMNNSSECPAVNENISKEESEETQDNLAEASLLAAETIKMAFEQKISINFKELNLNVSDSGEDSFRGLVPRSVLHDWLWGENPQIRIAGLSLIIETKKTSEEISEQDFGSLKIFLKYNLHSQCSAFRQQFISYFKKFVRRLKDGENFAHRKKNETVVQRYQDFLRWIWNFLSEKQGLFPGANFGRRCQALECLSELTQHFPEFKIFGVTDSNNLKYLRWLTDSYENNKIQAMQVLNAMPIKEFQDEQFCKNLFNEAVTLCKSVKPPDSGTGRYLMTLLMQKCSKFNIYNDSYSAYAILESLYSELEKIYETAESSSLIAVASESPFYGCIRCIRMILQHTKDYKQAENLSKYREYIYKLLKLCFKIDEILFPVLGSAAPEGFLPGLTDSKPEETKQVVRSLAAQMLLVCAWRSMKETCLLMADMCTWFQIEGESSSTSPSAAFLLTFKEVSEIGDHLLHLLKNLMHRGVFEQVFVGFKQLASRLWKSTSPALNNLPEKWLQEAMDQEHISSKSITRRSAGLPFIFQALLSAECDNEPFLHKWVQRLLILDESPEMSPIRIHSMNVLRGLFRDASFSAAMMPFVPQGLKMAFRGLKSSDWTERNSGLMLYGAVMRRCFGAKLNLMNAPTFFRKFPQMYDFLLEELDVCIQLMETRQKERGILKERQAVTETEANPQLTCDFTFHLLLLLSSFTATCRVEDTHFKLEAFIPRIRKCGESDDIEVRKLSAKAIVPFLVSPEDKRQLMLRILHEIESRNELLSQNQLHGKLFQFLTISTILVHEDNVASLNSNAQIATAFLSIFSSESVLKSLHGPTIFEVWMSILVSLNSLGCLKKGVIVEEGVNVVLKTFIERFGHIRLNRNFIPGLLVADKMVANGGIQIMRDNIDSESFVEIIYNYFVDSTLDSIPFVDEFLELFREDDRFSKIFFGGGKGTDHVPVVVIVETVLESYLRRSSSEFRKFPATIMELNYLKFLEAVPPSTFTNVEEGSTKCMISRLFELCDESNPVECTSLHIRASAFRILGNIVFTTGIPVAEENQTILCDMAVKWSASVADDDMRIAVAQSYPNVPFELMRQFSVVNEAKLWAGIFMLSQDDESYIRQLLNRKLTTSTGRPVCDRKSIEILISLYFKHFLMDNPLEGFIVLLGLLQRSDFEFEVKADDETEDRLFDKSEMNMYFEHEILTKVILKEMSEECSGTDYKVQDVGNAQLTPDQISLYNFLVNTQLADKTDLSGMTLRNLCSQTEFANKTNHVGLASVINDDSCGLIEKCVQEILNTL